jgi:hypothetical protein
VDEVENCGGLTVVLTVPSLADGAVRSAASVAALCTAKPMVVPDGTFWSDSKNSHAGAVPDVAQLAW